MTQLSTSPTPNFLHDLAAVDLYHALPLPPIISLVPILSESVLRLALEAELALAFAKLAELALDAETVLALAIHGRATQFRGRKEASCFLLLVQGVPYLSEVGKASVSIAFIPFFLEILRKEPEAIFAIRVLAVVVGCVHIVAFDGLGL